ncbi:MAG: aldehyde ferredoxin oxidoreductase C-terminal domain-containing protein [Candidatus Bathyarchaeia archaeon]
MLRVNLTKEDATIEDLDEETLRKYIGGTGLGAYILYKEVPPEVRWNDPENHLIVASGPLGGTIIPGSGTVSVVTKGPLTNGAVSVQANGFFGAFLRLSGFDGIVIKGVTRDWLYLYIDGEKVQFLDANKIVGKGTYETTDIIKKEHGKKEKEMSVASIGPAGENLVKFASIVIDRGHIAAHNGPGAVLGSKKLKAIAVARGNKRVPIVDNQKLRMVANTMLENVKKTDVFKWGTLSAILIGKEMHFLPVKNYTTNVWSVEERVLNEWSPESIRRKFSIKRSPCWACQCQHCNELVITTGPLAGLTIEEPEYEQLAAWGPNIGSTDLMEAILLSYMTDDLGMDVNESGWIISFLMECYEKGVITKEDLDGIELNWGNTDAVKKMLILISKREGIGDILAEGVKYASEKIGEGRAQDIAIYTKKGNTPRGHDHRIMICEQFYTCISNTGTIESHFSLGLRKYMQPPQTINAETATQLAAAVAETFGLLDYDDSLGVCRFNTLLNIDLTSQAVAAATGWDFTPEEAKIVGLRIANLLKAFNVRCGHTPDLDFPSKRYGSAVPDGPFKDITLMPYWERMLDVFYEKMQWDRKTGKPLPEILKKLELDYVIKDLWNE